LIKNEIKEKDLMENLTKRENLFYDIEDKEE